ncbi:hypothetical protein [Tenacibaculum amylolyticum]|uniref:hypothetical protein n=1 Tax=Tenacibaculum amylolyticum TaxID=104269 RepID=UPI003895D20A
MRYCFVFFCLLTFSGFSQTSDCSKFKTGTFKYIGSDEKDTVITRTDSIQTEQDNIKGVKFTGSVKWLSDCKYILTYTGVNNPNFNFIIGIKLNVDITSTTNSTYKYTAYNDMGKITGEIVKIE